uniref:Fibronectin type-III domain-containing protein n=1 Tax=Ciona savignyi TaxID=51511 RepID=H2YHU2_CIOSA
MTSLSYVQLKDLQFATLYYYGVSLRTANHTLPTSGSHDFHTEPGKPSPPTNVQVMQYEFDHSSLAVSWSPPRRANGNIHVYLVYAMSNGKQPIIQTTSSLGTVLSGLSNGVWNISVVARNNNGLSSDSSTMVQAVVGASAMATSGKANRNWIVITWRGEPPNVGKFIITVQGVYERATMVTHQVSKTTHKYNLTHLMPHMNYQYSVKAADKDGKLLTSSSLVTMKTTGPNITLPRITHIKPLDQSSVQVFWSPLMDASSYPVVVYQVSMVISEEEMNVPKRSKGTHTTLPGL